MSRPLRLGGALAVLLSLWMPWYVVRVPAGLGGLLEGRAAALPTGFAEFAQGLAAALPSRIDLTAWQAFSGADVAMALLAGAVAVLCVVETDARLTQGAAVALGLLVALHLLTRPGPAEITGLRFGAGIALLGAAAAVAGAFMDAGDAAAPAPWAPIPAEHAAASSSVAPPH